MVSFILGEKYIYNHKLHPFRFGSNKDIKIRHCKKLVAFSKQHKKIQIITKKCSNELGNNSRYIYRNMKYSRILLASMQTNNQTRINPFFCSKYTTSISIKIHDT